MITSVHDGAMPHTMLSHSVVGENRMNRPTTTRMSWVPRSSRARPMLSLAASLMPTVLMRASSSTTPIPAMMSHGLSRSGAQNTPR